MVDAKVPFFALLVIMVGMMAWYASFYGHGVVQDEFSNIQEPDGFLSTLGFLKDLAIAIGKTFWALVTFSGSDLPSVLLFPLRIIFGFTFALVVVMGLIALI